ncbi:hypothetical protein MesoLj131c_16400 [Mesorhizobium sp. 131-3-5]|uniref:hypothetical protein n=1 Tax=Mesorhizobium sp. 131-3-5 TaxID=2744520 RepID=UPI001928B28B|nr:hypothetical protein [Mesorhizobium sp. 131-3-5]BCH07382.1 hypothetical protein MesoLj131c_16400 [Mesorhizobium sp. 131-3-5]
MDPKAVLIMTSIAFVIGLVSWGLPAWKYHRKTEVGAFALALLFAGIVLLSMFKWTDVVLEVEGVKLQITERDQKISELQIDLLKARTALAEVQKQAPDTAMLASSITEAFQKKGVVVDQSTVKTIAKESLKPLLTYFDSPEWNATKDPGLFDAGNNYIPKSIAPPS